VAHSDVVGDIIVGVAHYIHRHGPGVSNVLLIQLVSHIAKIGLSE